MKKILVINGHPKAESYCDSLTEKYIEGVKKTGKEVKVSTIRNLNLEGYTKFAHNEKLKLSNDLVEVQKLITWANQLVFIYPTWWATPPALLKLFIEIVFHSGFAFQYTQPSKLGPRWDKLLTGKSAKMISTMDSPPWYYKCWVGDPGFKMMKDIMTFCGIKPVKRKYFGSVKVASEEKRKKWLNEVYIMGTKE
jgi:putative NADPH-quinone reductase